MDPSLAPGHSKSQLGVVLLLAFRNVLADAEPGVDSAAAVAS